MPITWVWTSFHQARSKKPKNIGDKKQERQHKMDTSFVKSLTKKITRYQAASKTVTKHEKAAQVRSLFLMLNREKYKQFSFATKDKKFWRIVSFKIVEFECDVNEMIVETQRAFQNQSSQNTQELSVLNKKVNYYNLVLKTLKKYDKRYGEKIGLTLNHLFCKDISHYIREFI